MVLAETVRVSGKVALARIPGVLWMLSPVWIRLNSVVGVPTHEEPVEGAALAICKLVISGHVLGAEHSFLSLISLF